MVRRFWDIDFSLFQKEEIILQILEKATNIPLYQDVNFSRCDAGQETKAEEPAWEVVLSKASRINRNSQYMDSEA
jgi:cation transport regulator ChaB